MATSKGYGSSVPSPSCAALRSQVPFASRCQAQSGKLSTLCLEHDCLERDTRRVGAEFAW